MLSGSPTFVVLEGGLLMVLFIVLAVIAAGLGLAFLYDRRHQGAWVRSSERPVDVDEQARVTRVNSGAKNVFGPGGS